MADPQQYTDAQLSDGTTLRFLGTLGPDEVRQKVQTYRQKQQISASPPPAAGGQFAGTAPKGGTSPTAAASMLTSGEQAMQHPGPGYTLPGAWPSAQPMSDENFKTYATAVGIPAGVAATAMGGTVALPFLAGAAKTHPTAAALIGQELISQARNLPGVGKYIPPYAEMLPWLLGHGKPAEQPGKNPVPPVRWGEPPVPEPAPQGGNLPVKWNPEPIPEPAPKQYPSPPIRGGTAYPEPEPAPKQYATPPVRWNPAEPEAEPTQQRPQAASPTVPKQTANTLDTLLKSATGAPKPIEPGVPMRAQGQGGMTPTQSSAVKAFKYDPAAQEMHVQSNDGTTYVHGEVSPEQAQAFQDAPSKGQAWKAIRDNSPLVRKVGPGKAGVNVKPAMKFRSADPNDKNPNDLTDILTRSLSKANGQ